MHTKYLLSCLLLSFSSLCWSQSDYRSGKEITTTLQSIASKNSKLATLKSLTTTHGGNDIWMLTLSEGAPESLPGIAIFAGVEGDHLLGTELAVEIAEKLLSNHKELLSQTSFYIFPNLSPDASQQYFERIRFARKGNALPTDDDRDGRLDEDPFEDLNNDGLITMMRVSDPTGQYKPLDEDERLMVKADIDKGERGGFHLYTEGIDNDKDGKFNEDGVGGVHFNKNFTFDFQYFTKGAGEHPISQKEHRALLDFLYTQWNIYAILTFGPANNLTTPLTYSKSGASKRVITSVLKEDEKINALISETYNDIVKQKDAPKSAADGGSAFEWSYFHFGRLALSTPAWWPKKFKGDSLNEAPKNKVANFLALADAQNRSDVFIDWKSVTHPDFPDKKVEIGGLHPFAMKQPAYSEVDTIATTHTNFIVQLAQMQPKLAWVNVKQEKVASNLTRITAELHNSGQLPTHTEMGDKSRWLRKINVYLKLKNNQELRSGKPRTVIEKIAADGSVAFSWLVQGSGTVTLEATLPQAGTDTLTLKL
ncbi:MAG: peptidase [Cytophagaceae bacterium]|nr:peptidase [Cytophagaceae bacterium]